MRRDYRPRAVTSAAAAQAFGAEAAGRHLPGSMSVPPDNVSSGVPGVVGTGDRIGRDVVQRPGLCHSKIN